jgi:hypothetical protein
MAFSSITSIIVALCAYLLYYFIIYPILISPLSKIPSAHRTSSILPIWIWWKRRRGQENRTIYAAHLSQGPIVKLAPKEISVSSQDGMRKIYVGGFERTEWFLQFSNYDRTPNLVTLFDGKAHATRKRMISHVYSKSYLLDSADFQAVANDILFRRFLPLIDDAARMRGDLDMVDLGYAVGAEMMSAYIMGLENGYDLVRSGNEGKRRRYLENARKKMRNLKGSKIAAKELEQECLQMCEKARVTVANKEMPKVKVDLKETALGTFPVVYAQLSSSISEGEPATATVDPSIAVASELLDNIEASREGVGITLVYALYELSKRPNLQSDLHHELISLQSPLIYPGQGPLSTSTLRKLDSLPFLDGILMETLRLHHPSPGPQRRIVPREGSIIDGYFIPGGVTISSSAYSLHRQSSAFPDSETWKPERWVRSPSLKEDKLTHNGGTAVEDDDPRRWFFAWGRGGRMCIGSHFAILTLKLLLASIYTNFTTIILEDYGMEHRDELMASPVGDKLVLRFEDMSKATEE